MNNNDYPGVDLVENYPDGENINTEELNQLMLDMTSQEKEQVVIHCKLELRKIRKQLFLRDFKYAILGILFAILLSIALSYLFSEYYFPLLILPCVYVLFLLRPKNPPVVQKASKYTNFKILFSSN